MSICISLITIYYILCFFFLFFPFANHHIKVKLKFWPVLPLSTHVHRSPPALVLSTFSSSPFNVFTSFFFFFPLPQVHYSPDFLTLSSSFVSVQTSKFQFICFGFSYLQPTSTTLRLSFFFFFLVADLVLSFNLWTVSFIIFSSPFFPKFHSLKSWNICFQVLSSSGPVHPFHLKHQNLAWNAGVGWNIGRDGTGGSLALVYLQEQKIPSGIERNSKPCSIHHNPSNNLKPKLTQTL